MSSKIFMREHKAIPAKWHTVPDFISLQSLTDEDRYHLFEGYCISVLDCKPSGRNYNRILIDGDYHQFLSYVGQSEWWNRYEVERNWLRRLLFGHWRTKQRKGRT